MDQLSFDTSVPTSRREVKQKIVALQTMLRARDISTDNRLLIEKHITELRKQSLTVQSAVTKEMIQKRRDFVQNNPGLRDIFHAMWMVFFKFTNDGYLSKEGYIKFNRAILISLGGFKSFDDLQGILENDWNHDKAVFGPFDRQGFFDLLFETIEIWTEVVNPSHYAVFAWSLLDSIADTSTHPPKLRPFREVRCVTKLENEASMINSYLKNKKIRSALSIDSEWLDRVPEVQKRLQSRKYGSEFTQDQAMIEAITRQTHISEEEASYSDSDLSSQRGERSKLSEEVGIVSISELLRNKGEEVDDDNESKGNLREDDDSFNSSQLSDEEETSPPLFDSSQIQFRSKRAFVPARKSTVSFMNYVESRRKSRVELNRVYFQRPVDSEGNLGEGGASNPVDQSVDRHRARFLEYMRHSQSLPQSQEASLLDNTSTSKDQGNQSESRVRGREEETSSVSRAPGSSSIVQIDSSPSSAKNLPTISHTVLQVEGRTLISSSQKVASNEQDKTAARTTSPSKFPSSLEELQPFLLRLDQKERPAQSLPQPSSHQDSSTPLPSSAAIADPSKEQSSRHGPTTSRKQQRPVQPLRPAKQDLSSNLFQEARSRQSLPASLSTLSLSPAIYDGPCFSIPLKDLGGLDEQSQTSSSSSSFKAVKAPKRSFFGENLPPNKSHDPLQPQVVQALKHQRELEEQRRERLEAIDSAELSFLASFLDQSRETKSSSAQKARFSLLLPKREEAMLVKSRPSLLKEEEEEIAAPSLSLSSISRSQEASLAKSLEPVRITPIDLKLRDEANFYRFYKRKAAREAPAVSRSTNAHLLFDRRVAETRQSNSSILTPIQPDLPKVPSFPRSPGLEASVSDNPSKLSITDTLSSEEFNDKIQPIQSFFALTEEKTKEIQREFHQEQLSLDPEFLVSLRRQKYEYSYQLSDTRSFQKKTFRNLQIPSRSPIQSPSHPIRSLLNIVGSDRRNLYEGVEASLSHCSSSVNDAPPSSALPWLKRSKQGIPSSSTVNKSSSNGTLISEVRKEVIQRDNVFNRSNLIDVWKDKLELMKYGDDSTKHFSVIHQQRQRRQAFESYVRSFAHG